VHRIVRRPAGDVRRQYRAVNVSAQHGDIFVDLLGMQVLFRSVNKLLMDTATSEYLFCADFFGEDAIFHELFALTLTAVETHLSTTVQVPAASCCFADAFPLPPTWHWVGMAPELLMDHGACARVRICRGQWESTSPLIRCVTRELTGHVRHGGAAADDSHQLPAPAADEQAPHPLPGRLPGPCQPAAVAPLQGAPKQLSV